MTSWVWIAIGYGVTATAFAGYLTVLVRATGRLRRRAEGSR